MYKKYIYFIILLCVFNSYITRTNGKYVLYIFDILSYYSSPKCYNKIPSSPEDNLILVLMDVLAAYTSFVSLRDEAVCVCVRACILT